MSPKTKLIKDLIIVHLAMTLLKYYIFDTATFYHKTINYT